MSTNLGVLAKRNNPFALQRLVSPGPFAQFKSARAFLIILAFLPWASYKKELKSVRKENVRSIDKRPSETITSNASMSVFNSIEVNKNHFNFDYVIGRGGFGKVWKVELRKEKKLYAMKEMAKARIISKRSVNSVMNEKKFLCQLQHPFLVNMHYAFEDRDNLYLVIDLMSGGDLRFHIGKHRRFSEEQTSK